MNSAGQRENIEIYDVFFQNGRKYTSSIFSNGNLIKLSRYFTCGKLSSECDYKNGILSLKKIYTRDGTLAETITYSYYDTGKIASIIKESRNNIVSVTFIRDNTSNITNIRIRQNNIIIRMIDYEYTNNSVICSDTNQFGTVEYTLFKHPVADESWLAIHKPSSIIMRKLSMAMPISS